MYIRPIKFLEKKSLEIEYNTDNIIYERYFNLDRYDNYKKKVIKKVINKDNNKKTLK